MPGSETRRSVLLGAASLAAVTSLVSPALGQGKSTIRAVMHAALGPLDPFAVPNYITRNHGYLVYDTLFALDAENRPQPQMVQSWTVSNDALTFTFALRPGLRFHDGAPVTAADAVASLRRWMPRDAMGIRLASVMDNLTVASETEFRLVLKRPYALVLETLAKPSAPVPFILPRHLVEIPDAARITEALGSGPFRFVASEYRPGNRVVYERFDDYVPRAEPASGLAGGKVARLNRVEWLEISDPQTAVNALLAGEVQIMENIPPDMMQVLRRTRGITLKPRSFGNSLMLRLNSAQAPFDNPRTRRAVMTAIRQTDYLDAQIGDDTLAAPCNSILSCDSPWRADVPGPGADPAHARELLQASGYAGEKAIILHPADLPQLSAIAPVTENVLRGIGMNVQLDALDWRSMLVRRARNVPVSDGGWSITPGIFSNLDLMNPVVNRNLDASGPGGYAGWAKDPEMERLLDAFTFETDARRQQDLATELQLLSTEDAFSIPLGGFKVVTGYRNELKDVVADQVLVFWNMELG